MYVCAPCMYGYPRRPEEGARSPRTEVDIWEPPCGCFKGKPGLLKSILTAEPSPAWLFLCVKLAEFRIQMPRKSILLLYVICLFWRKGLLWPRLPLNA